MLQDFITRKRFPPLAASLLVASLAVGLAFPFLNDKVDAVVLVIAKGAGVALLAVAAAGLDRKGHGWLAAIMAAGAIGDVLLELPGLFLAGAGAFAVGHCIAMAFYGRNPGLRSGFDRLAALALIGWGLAMPGFVSPPGTPIGALMLYSVLVCGMAAALLLSRFGRVAALGGLLFVVSDTLLIMRLGGTLVGSPWVHGLLVWWTYYVGQAFIFVGVAVGLPTKAPQ